MSILDDFLKQRLVGADFATKKAVDIAKEQEIQRKGEEAKAFLAKSPVAQFFSKRGLSEFGAALKSTGKEILRAVPRALATFGLEKEAQRKQQAAALFEGKVEAVEPGVIIPTTETQKFIFGERPVGGFAATGAETLMSFGADESVVERYSLPLGFALATLDILPGFGKGKVSKEIAEQLIRRYGDDTAKIILARGKTFALKAAAKQGDEFVEKAGLVVIKSTDNIATIAAKTQKKIVDQRFRADKLNLPAKQIREIEKRLSVLGLKKRSVRTFKDMEEAAQLLGATPEQLVKQTATGRITDAEVVALRNLVNNNSNFIVNAERQIAKNADLAATLNPKIIAAAKQTDAALKKSVIGGTEAGRALVAHRIMAQNTLEPAFWLKRAKKALGNKELTTEMQNAILGLIDNQDRQGLATFINLLEKPGWTDQAITLYKAGLLTSPTTHLANISGNIGMASLETFKDIPATGLDALIALATGKRTTTITAGTIAAKLKGFGKGAKNATRVIKGGIYDDALLTKWDLPKGSIFKNKILKGYTESIFKSLQAEDVIFKGAALSESLEKQALVMAKNQGIKGAAKQSFVRELLMNPTNGMVKQAINEAEFATFQNPNVLAKFIQSGKAAVAQKGLAGKGLNLAAEGITPFTTTPANVAARIADYSPVGFIKAIIRVANPTTRSQLNLVNDLGRAITGTGIIAFGAMLAKKGFLTGNAPTNEKERQQFFAEGKQANSILINGRWYSLNRISPFGNLLTLGANFHEAGETKEGIPVITTTAFQGIKGLTEQTYLKGLSDALKALEEPEKKGAKFAEQRIASLIPTIVGKFARIADPNLRIRDSIFDELKAKIPFASGTLPVRRNIFGEPVVAPGGKLAIIDPFQTTKAVDDPVINEAKRLNMVIGLPNQKVLGVKMTDEEYDVYQQKHGRNLKKDLLAMVSSNANYKKLSDDGKLETLQDIIARVRSDANDFIFIPLMIQRYNLPEDTNPLIFKELLRQAAKNEKWKSASVEEQGAMLRKNLDRNILGR